MNFTKGMKVKINPSIATRGYLNNCYFDISIPRKLKEIAKGTEYIISGTDIIEHTRDGKKHKCVRLEDFGWIPEEAIVNVFNFLKIGYAFKTRNENIYLCAENNGLNLKTLSSRLHYKDFYADGTNKKLKESDIVAVYAIGNSYNIREIFNGIPVWEPENPKKEMTIAEIEKA